MADFGPISPAQQAKKRKEKGSESRSRPGIRPGQAAAALPAPDFFIFNLFLSFDLTLLIALIKSFDLTLLIALIKHAVVLYALA